MARKMVKDKAKYFGPYTSAGAVKDTIDLIRKIYHIRSCNRKLPKDIGKERPCLNYHIHQCDAPCQGYVSEEEYRKSIAQVLLFLNGNYDLILKELEQKMQEAAENLEFEKMCIRDSISYIFSFSSSSIFSRKVYSTHPISCTRSYAKCSKKPVSWSAGRLMSGTITFFSVISTSGVRFFKFNFSTTLLLSLIHI